MTRLAVFDCDGTLVDGQAEICQSMRDAFDHVGLTQPDPNEVRRMVGLSLPVAVRKLVPDVGDGDAAALVDAYKQSFFARRSSGQLNEVIYEGIAELLHALRDDGWLLAVATGKSDRGLLASLETHGIRDLFVSLQTADRHPSKPHPAMLEAALFEAGVAPADAVMIGDTSFDIHMAREANVRGVGVAWGYHAPSELLDAGAEAVAERPADLKDLL